MSLEILVRELFDYAGMFPPASLTLEDALRESARLPEKLVRPHLLSADMVLSYSRLSELTPMTLEETDFLRPVRLAILGTSLERAEEELQGVAARRSIPADASVVSYEVVGGKLPGELRELEALSLSCGTRVYFELPKELMPEAVKVLEAKNKAASQKIFGVKVRGSGERSLRIGEMAEIVKLLSTGAVPLKVTAGLHHPVIEERYGNEHGFLNLAAALFLSEKLSLHQIREILENSDAKAFDFGSGVTWRDISLTEAEVQQRWQSLDFRIGSCSLLEPDHDLNRLYGAPK